MTARVQDQVQEQLWSRTPRRPRLGASPRSVAVVLVAVGVVVDLAVQSRAGGFAAMAACVLSCVGLMTAGRVTRPGGRLLLGGAAGLSVFLFVRASPWLITLDVVTVLVLVAMGCSAEQLARPFDSRFVGAGRRMWATTVAIVTAGPHAVWALAALLPQGDSASRRLGWALLRGLVLAVPIVAILGLFLASADPVFASQFDRDVNWASVSGHLLVVSAAVWVLSGFFVQATRPPVLRSVPKRTVGAVEGLVVMACLTAVYTAFALTQLVVARRGADYVLRTTGLTYAEYARSGFFQLLGVAALTALVLLWLRSAVQVTTRSTERAVAGFGVLASVLTLAIVHTALLRLQLYDDAFGSTLLRFYSSAAAWWLGAVFVLVGMAFLVGARVRREWLPTAIGCSVVVAVLVLNVVDPDRAVLEHNLAREDVGTGPGFDVWYATTLSADATPTLVAALPLLGEDQRVLVARRMCHSVDPAEPTPWNLSQRRAAEALEELCG